MSMNTETAALNSSSLNDDGVIRRFLLGELNAQERVAFESRLLTSDDLEARLRLHEISIVDDYVAGELSRPEANRVRERFLVTRDRSRMVSVARALHDRFSLTASPEVSARSGNVFNLRRTAWRYAFAAAILLILFATVWLGVKERRVAIRLPIPKPVQPKPSPTQSPVVAHHPTGSSEPTHSQDATPRPDHQTTLSMTLDAKNTVDNPFELKLTDNAITSLHIAVTLETEQVSSYRADVWNSRGESVFSADDVMPNAEGKVTLEIPALDLSAGEYMIRLQATKDAQGLSYYFRLVR